MNRIKIRLKSLDFRVLDQACEKLVNNLKKTKITGPILLSNEIKGNVKMHRRFIEIVEPTTTVINSLIQMKMANGVEIELKQLT